MRALPPAPAPSPRGAARSLILAISVATALAAPPFAAVARAAADLALQIAADDWTPTEGLPVSFTLQASNAGPNTATGIQVLESLVPELTYASHSAMRGTYDSGSGVWAIDSLAAGETVTLTVTATPNAGSGGRTLAQRAAVVQSSSPDPDPSDDADTVSVVVQGPKLRVLTGSYVGNGAAGRAITGVGFEPDLLLVKGEGNTPAIARTRTMAGDLAKELGVNTAAVAGRISSLDPGGFTVGSHASVNAAGVVYHWTAFLEAPGQMRVGSYVGDGLDNRNLAGLGLMPAYAMILSAAADEAIQRFPAQTGDASLLLGAGGELADRIQRFDPDGFQVGANAQVNAAGVVHHYVAWSTLPGLVGGASYLGDGQDDRTNAGLGFRPHLLLVARRDGGGATMLRTLEISGDLSLPVDNASGLANAIQELTATGFQVGSHASVNSASKTFLYAAFRDGVGGDLDVRELTDVPLPAEGDTLNLIVATTNYGPQAQTGIRISAPVPTSLTLVSMAASAGSYAPGTGVWSVDSLASGASAGLAMRVVVNAGTAGSTIVAGAQLTASDRPDVVPANDAATISIPVQMVDIAIDLNVDDLTPVQGQNPTFTLIASNRGTAPARSVTVDFALPAGLSLVSQGASQGTWVPATGTWTVGDLPVSGSAALAVTTAPGGSIGSSYRLTARGAAPQDVDSANDADSVTIVVHRAAFRVVTGSYVGNGVAGRAIAGVGFQPDLLLVKGEGVAPTIARTRTIPGDGGKELGLPNPIVLGRITDLGPDGFTVGSDPSVNATGTTYHWTAFLESPGQMSVGSYIGNATDNRSIAGLGLQPGYAIVMSGGAKHAMQRFGGEVGDASLAFEAGTELADRIQRFDADGFQVGQHADVNAAAVVYHYVAWAGSDPRIEQALYVGDGLDDRAVSTVGFRPSFLLVKRLDNSIAAIRTASVTGDVTLPAAGAAPYADGVQALLANGFQVGRNAAVNSSGKVYAWVAFRDIPSLDLALSSSVSDSLPNEGGTVTFTVTLRNLGPENASGVNVTDVLAPGLSYRTHVPSRGAYDPGSGTWVLGTVANGDSARLLIVADVDPGTAGSVLTNVAFVSSMDQTDLDGANDMTSASVRVQSADLSLAMTADQLTPLEGEIVTFQVSVVNAGPDAATSLTVRDLLPAELRYQQATTDHGSYASATGTWSAGTLAPGDTARLMLEAAVAAGTGGTGLVNAAAITHADQADPVQAAQSDSVTVYVAIGPGILVVGEQPGGTALPGASRAHVMTLTLRNSTSDARLLQGLILHNRTRGPGSQAQLDAELGALSLFADDGDGVFDPSRDTPLRAAQAVGGGVAFDSLTVAVSAGSLTQLHLVTDVPRDARDGDTLDVSIDRPEDAPFDVAVTPLNTWPVDPSGGVVVDGMSAAQVDVRAVPGTTIRGATGVPLLDLVVPPHGYAPDSLQDLRFVNLGNATLGPDVLRYRLWADGGNGAFDSGSGDDIALGDAVVEATAFAVTGLSVAVPVGGRRFYVSADVASNAHAGSTIRLALGGTATAGLSMASANDGPIDAPVAGNEVVILRGPSTIVVTGLPQSPAVLGPGDPGIELFAVRISNPAAEAETLTTVTLRNTTQGPGTIAQRDAELQPLRLVSAGDTLGTVTMTGGAATFSGLHLVLSPGDTVTLRVNSGASVVARDGDQLDVRLALPSDLGFSRTVILSASWPIDPPGSFGVDGMVAAQLQLDNRSAPDILAGSVRNLALAVHVPPNGYAADTLRFLLVRNDGDAVQGIDIARLEAWADDGDSLFEATGPSADARLGTLSASGDSWVLTGLANPIPPGGRWLFLSCDVSADAGEGRTVRLVLPSSPVPGLGVSSPNDGPRDVDVANPVPITITTENRVTVAARAVAPGTVSPGATQVVLLHLSARNTYDTPQTLTGLTFENRSSDPQGASPTVLDAQFRRIEVRTDTPLGVVLATSAFSGGRAVCGGFTWDLAPGQTRDLFVMAEIAADATDGDVLGAEIANESGLVFSNPTAISARFPLSSGAAWSVDGMVASQITNVGAPGAVVSPGEGPLPALEWIVPRNGPHDDELEQVKLVNAGTASAADLSEVRLWRDGGDNQFDAGVGDDIDLGPMTFVGGKWQSSILSEPIGAAGVRLHAAVTLSPDAADSVTVRLEIPVRGVFVVSGNDGPVDVPVTNPDEILASRSGLLVNFAPGPTSSVVGDTLPVRVIVRNTGPLGLSAISLSTLASVPDSTFGTAVGPQPPSLDLESGGQAEFLWTVRANRSGAGRLRVAATGIEVGTEREVRSPLATSIEHRVFIPATRLDLYPIQAMPFSVFAGQSHVVPLNLTFTNSGGAEASDILLQSLTVRLEDETGAGVVPSQLLSRVVLDEGATIYAQLDAPPTTGSTFVLVPSTPIRVRSASGGEQITLSLALDIAPTAQVPNFRLVIDSASSLPATDAINGAPVPVQLEQGLVYPVRSGLARLIASVSSLDVSNRPLGPRDAGRGQSKVPLLGIQCTNPGPSGLGPDLRVSRFAVRLTDSAGVAIPTPSTRLRRIRVSTALATLLDRAVTAEDDTAIVLTLPSLLSVSASAGVDVDVTADLADDADLGPLRLRLAGSESFVIRNSANGDLVPAAYATDPIEGDVVTVHALAASVLARSIPRFPTTVFLGETDVKAIEIGLRHPGPAETGPVDCESLTFRVRDAAGVALPPASILRGVRVLWRGALVGGSSGLPDIGGPFTLPLAGVRVGVDSIEWLDVRVDIDAAAPTTYVQLNVGAGDIAANDSYSSAAVPVAPDSSAEFPMTSGITSVAAPARELSAFMRDSMPAGLIVDGGPVPVATLVLRNPAAVGTIHVDTLAIVASDRDFQTLAIGGVATSVQAFVNGSLWAEATGLAGSALTATLAGASPIEVGGSSEVGVELRVVVRPPATRAPFRIGIRSDGIGIVQPSSPLLAIALVAGETQSFPFWTRVGSVNEASLAQSWSNFPNPFAAGRGATTFMFYLKQAAHVSLRIWTARGEAVATILEDQPRASGLNQSDRWDGRNGDGRVVTNGVYVAELEATFVDGTTERVLRKLAVVR